VPEVYLKSNKSKKGLFETRIQLGSNIWRIFCFFDEEKPVVLLNGFQKKTKRPQQKKLKEPPKSWSTTMLKKN
jgi:phage-related protein